jgi:hypothetical protein
MTPVWAKPILADYMQTEGATPWAAIELIAGWRRDGVPILEQNLVSLTQMAVELGPGTQACFRRLVVPSLKSSAEA